VRWLAQFFVLATPAILLPFFIHIQWLTGPIINAILILAVIVVGIRAAMVIALIPSLIALGSGLIPAILAPVVPFIMIANVVLILAVDYFYNNRKSDSIGYANGVVVGAVLKFALLYFSVDLIAKLLIKQELVTAVASMMGWMQLMTALAGGVIAWVVLKFLKFVK